MLFTSDNKKTQIVPILPAASREAGRVVTSSDAPAQKKSGLVSAVRPTVGGASGMRNAVSPAMANAPTQLLPAVEHPRSKRDGRSVAIWLLSSLLALNMLATALLLWNMDQPNPELVEQKVQLELAIEEFNKMKSTTNKFMREFESRTQAIQVELENASGQWQLIDSRARDNARALEVPPTYGADGNSTGSYQEGASK